MSFFQVSLLNLKPLKLWALGGLNDAEFSHQRDFGLWLKMFEALEQRFDPLDTLKNLLLVN